MNAKLVIVGADIKPGEYKLKLPAVLGRGKEATLKLVHSLVSRAHCEIFEIDGQLMVRDLGSLNGTYVAGQRIAEAVPLPSGELLTVGSVTFRADYGEDVVLMPPPNNPGFRSEETQEVVRGVKETLSTGEKEQVWVDPSDAPLDEAQGSAAEDDFFGFLGDDESEPPASAEDQSENDQAAESRTAEHQPPADVKPVKPSSDASKKPTNGKPAQPDSKANPAPAKKNQPAPAEHPAEDENPFAPPDHSEHPGEHGKSEEDQNWDSFLDDLQ